MRYVREARIEKGDILMSAHVRLVRELVEGAVRFRELKEQGVEPQLIAAVVAVSLAQYCEPPDRSGRVLLQDGFSAAVRRRALGATDSEIRWFRKILRNFGLLVTEDTGVYLRLPKDLRALVRQLAKEAAAQQAEMDEYHAQQLSALTRTLRNERQDQFVALMATEYMLVAHRGVQHEELARFAELLCSLHRGVGYYPLPSLGVFVGVLNEILRKPPAP
jgi:hypothetical protein